MDMASCLPIDIAVLLLLPFCDARTIATVMAFLRVPKLLLLARVPALASQLERLPEALGAGLFTPLRLLQLVFTILLIGHWCSCVFFTMSRYHILAGEESCENEPGALYNQGCSYRDTWVQQLIYENKLAPDGGSDASRYLRAMYWAVPALTLAINGDFFPLNYVESTFIFMVMFCGVAISGTIVGNLIALATHSEGATANAMRQHERLQQHLEGNRVATPVVHKCATFMKFLMTERCVCFCFRVLRVWVLISRFTFTFTFTLAVPCLALPWSWLLHIAQPPTNSLCPFTTV